MQSGAAPANRPPGKHQPADDHPKRLYKRRCMDLQVVADPARLPQGLYRPSPVPHAYFTSAEAGAELHYILSVSVNNKDGLGTYTCKKKMKKILVHCRKRILHSDTIPKSDH